MLSFKKFFNRKRETFFSRIQEKKVLEEGLIVSYGVENLITKIFYIFKNDLKGVDRTSFFSDKTKYGIVKSVFFRVKNTINLKLFIKILDMYGYYIAAKKNIDDEIDITVEPKYTQKIEPEKIKNLNIYHVTDSKHLEKIFKIGLSPKTSKTRFSHPSNRIYLFITNDIFLVKDLKKTLVFDKNLKTSDMVILKVKNLEQDMYIDSSFEQNSDYVAGFVLKNIPPYELEIYG